MTGICAQRATEVDGLCSLTRPPNVGPASLLTRDDQRAEARADSDLICTGLKRPARARYASPRASLRPGCGSASARVPDVRMGAPTGSGTPRCGCGAGRVTAARPRAWTRRSRPTPRPLPPTGIHKLYERVVAPYLKNAHLEEGDKRWTGPSLACCGTQSIQS